MSPKLTVNVEPDYVPVLCVLAFFLHTLKRVAAMSVIITVELLLRTQNFGTMDPVPFPLFRAALRLPSLLEASPL